MLVQNRSSISFSTVLALVSFVIGTILMLLHFSFPSHLEIVVLGFLYVILAFFLNSVMFVYLAFQYLTKRNEREIIAIRILILLSNLPIAFIYLNLVFNNRLF